MNLERRQLDHGGFPFAVDGRRVAAGLHMEPPRVDSGELEPDAVDRHRLFSQRDIDGRQAGQ